MGPREILRLSFPDLGSLEREIATNIRYGRLFVGEVLDAPVLSEGDLVLVHPVHGRELRLLAQVVMVNSDGPMRGTGIALRGFGPTEVERLQAFVREQAAANEQRSEAMMRGTTVPPTAPENDWSDLATSGFARSTEGIRTTPPPVAPRVASVAPMPSGPIATPLPVDFVAVRMALAAEPEPDAMLAGEQQELERPDEGERELDHGEELVHDGAPENEDEDAHAHAHAHVDEDSHVDERAQEAQQEDSFESEADNAPEPPPSAAEDDFSDLNDSPPLAAAAVESPAEDGDEGEQAVDEDEAAEFDGDPSLEPPKNTDLQAGESRQERLRSLNVVAQLKIARRGELADRIVVERLYGKTVWEALLQNPRITLPEVARIARKGTVPRPLIEAILENGMWIRDVNVRRSLLSNPKLPSDGILKLLRPMAKHELKLLERAAAYPMSVRDAARKLLREQQT